MIWKWAEGTVTKVFVSNSGRVEYYVAFSDEIGAHLANTDRYYCYNDERFEEGDKVTICYQLFHKPTHCT